MNLEHIDMDQFANLSPEERMAILDGGELPGAQAQESTQPQEGATQEPQGVTVPQPSAEEVAIQETHQEPERKGNPEVPIKHLREQNRQLQTQLEQMQALLSNPQALQQFIGQQQPQPAQPAPELAIESPDAISHLVANHPMVQKAAQAAQQFEQLSAQLQHEREMSRLKGEYGPEVEQHVTNFDAVMPQMRGIPPEAKVLMMLGAMSRSPQAQQQQQQQVKDQAIAVAQQALEKATAQTKQVPRTLANVTPAQPNEPEVDIGSMDMDAFEKMSPEKRRAMRSQY